MGSSNVYFKSQFWVSIGLIEVRFSHHRKGKSDDKKYNVHPLVSRLVLGKMATYNELQTIYCLKDMVMMDEILNIKEEAEYIARQKVK